MEKKRKNSGTEVIEFAFVIIPLLLITGGIVEFGRVFWYYNALAKATRDGARFMSMQSDIPGAISAAKQLVIDEANAANVSPALTAANVSVDCLNASFQLAACAGGPPPANVRVGISTAWGAASDYNVTIGGWIPFFVPTGGTTTFSTTFAPHTTMRYME